MAFKGNLLDAIDTVKEQIPNLTDKLLKEFHAATGKELENGGSKWIKKK